jgi:hypothetical protein
MPFLKLKQTHMKKRRKKYLPAMRVRVGLFGSTKVKTTSHLNLYLTKNKKKERTKLVVERHTLRVEELS